MQMTPGGCFRRALHWAIHNAPPPASRDHAARRLAAAPRFASGRCSAPGEPRYPAQAAESRPRRSHKANADAERAGGSRATRPDAASEARRKAPRSPATLQRPHDHRPPCRAAALPRSRPARRPCRLGLLQSTRPTGTSQPPFDRAACTRRPAAPFTCPTAVVYSRRAVASHRRPGARDPARTAAYMLATC